MVFETRDIIQILMIAFGAVATTVRTWSFGAPNANEGVSRACRS